jgi:hemoglobin
MPRLTPALAVLCALLLGCAGPETKEDDFYTSGSRDADQRAEQRISKEEQLSGEGEGGGKGKADAKPPLYDRLGGERGVRRIVDDFVDRAVVDPRVNWTRKGLTRGGLLGVGARSAEWSPTAENVARLKNRLCQFIAVATGGPPRYDGREMKAVHDGMRITNAEFDSAIGALKASLDALLVATAEQKELIAVFESTRPLLVEAR